MSEVVAPQVHVDPDAQAIVTDFIDYTEHLPSDVRRSLALIEKLNGLIYAAHDQVHVLTKQWSAQVDVKDGLSAEQVASDLRSKISYQKELSKNYARASLAEARRIDQEIARHQNLLSLTGFKLDALPLPPSRDPTPKPVSPQASRGKVNEPKIRLRLEKNKISAHTTGGGAPKFKRRRVLVVPGEVLPPPNPNSPTLSAFSDWESPSPAFSLSAEPLAPPKRKYKKKYKVVEEGDEDDGVFKMPKKKKERAPRDPGRMGTNVHSAVAGISTSNALMLLTPPPTDPIPGSRHAPWTRLTEYEMARLRKRMKKNAVWTPSDTMIRRELADAGRGPENYLKAKEKAEDEDEELLDYDNLAAKANFGELKPGEIALTKSKLTNKGMSLNAQKKQKRALLAQEEAKEQEQAREVEVSPDATVDPEPPKEPRLKLKEPSKERNQESIKESSKEKAKKEAKATPKSKSKQPVAKDHQVARSRAENMESQLSMLGPSLRNLFSRPEDSPAETRSSTQRALKKRKRQSSSNQLSEESQLHSQLHSEIVVTPSPSSSAKPSKKRKTAATTLSALDSSPLTATVTTTSKVPLAAAASSPTKHVAGADSPSTGLRRNEPRRQSLVIKPPAPPSRRSSRNSTPALDRPPSRSSPRIASGRQSTEPHREGRTRRKSDTPATPVVPSTAASSRSKRPAPGPVTNSREGGNAISIGKRQKKPAKRGSVAVARKAAEGSVKEDGGGEDEQVDPNEPRYCVCADVSWGTMVQCENDDCENQWFHLECVGLAEIPPRRTKWWCTDCAVKLGKVKA